MDGWIKLHRKIIENSFLIRDTNAFKVFVVLLMLVDRKTGIWEGGRFQLAEKCGLKPTTTYATLKRLKKHKMMTLSSNNKYSTISIVNWHKYQGNGDSTDDNTMTTRRQQDDTLTRSKEIKNKEIIYVETQKVYDLFISLFNKNPNTYKLTEKRKLKIKARLADAGLEMLQSAIEKTSKSKFHNGDNDRGWCADLDFIIRSYEQVERLSQLKPSTNEVVNNNIAKFMEEV